SYGTIIPLLYEYASTFGLTAFWISLLFASFSIFQFIANPIIGRLSDIYGRKPLFFLSVLGTSISFAIFAPAQTVFMLFRGRLLDGLTGGNIAIAQPTIADLHKGQRRSQAFGILWSVFGLGFALGPALGGVLSIYGLNVPFWIGSLLALVN